MNASAIGWRGQRPNKFRNVPTEVDGIWFQSRREARRYSELKLMERAKYITDLALQVKFPLKVDGQLIGHYCADFVYQRDGKQVIEDVKGVTTPLFDWKAKHFKAQYGQAIEIVR